MSNQEKYILYGASFNPPHLGHFSAICQMLEEHDKVIVFPYPKKYVKGGEELLPPIGQRMKMLEIFAAEFFPRVADRLIITNLAAELHHRDRVKEGILHTYDYLQFVKGRLPVDSKLSVCLGFEVKNITRREDFYKEKEIKEEFEYFYLQEDNNIKSTELREFFSGHKVIKSKKDEEYIRCVVGDGLADYIFSQNLYGLSKKAKKTDANIAIEDTQLIQDISLNTKKRLKKSS